MTLLEADGLTRINQPQKGGLRGIFGRQEETATPVYDLSFRMDEGEICVVYGDAKSGSSTLLRLLAGSLVPSTGTAALYGLNPAQNQKKLSARVGEVSRRLVRQAAGVTPAEYFERCKAEHGIPAADYASRVAVFSALFRVGDCWEQPFYRLSRNEQVCCMLTAALLHRPKLLFLDLPTEALEVIEQVQLREFLHLLHREEHVSLFLTTERLEDIQLASRVLVLEGGRLVFDHTRGAFQQAIGEKKLVRLTLAEAPQLYGIPNARLLEQPSPLEMVLEVDFSRLTLQEFLDKLAGRLVIDDVTVEELPFRRVVKKLNELR